MSVAVEAAPRPSKKRGLKWWKSALLYAILVPGAILFVAPLVWMISASFQPVGDMFSWPPQWIPENPTVEGYKLFFGIVATSITVLQLFFNSLAAYVFAKRKFPGRDAIFLLFLATMMVPSTVTLIPNYLVLKHIPLFGGNDIWGIGGHGMLDSYYGLILPNAVSAFGIFLLRQYMQSIPDDLLDAARIDGASEFKIFWKVVLPLCRPALAAMFIFTFTFAWEDFLWPLIITSNPDLYTAPLGLALFTTRNRTSWDMLMAGSVIATIPMILVFMMFQRQFISGISLSGMKA
jgi:multiple sugar transport system permease protein